MFLVRDATVGDLTRLVAFSIGLAQNTEGRQLNADLVAAGVGKLLENRALGFVLVAEAHGRVIGELMVGGREWSEWLNGEYWWITSLCVVPSWEDKGVAKALCDRAKEIAQKSDTVVLGLRASVYETNTWAREVLAPAVGSSWNGYLVFEQTFGAKRLN